MRGIIVLENEASQTSLERTISAVQAQNQVSTVLIAKESCATFQAIDNLAVISGSSVTESIHSAAAMLNTESVVVIDARIPLSSDQISNILSAGAAMRETLGFCSFESKANDISAFPEMLASDIVHTLTSNTNWVTAAAAVKSTFIHSANDIEASSSGEYLTKLAIKAIADSEAITSSLAALKLSGDAQELLDELSVLSPAETAECLRHTINFVNIEELFPNHSWDLHGKESVAACYHTLTAHFIRLNDIDSALESFILKRPNRRQPPFVGSQRIDCADTRRDSGSGSKYGVKSSGIRATQGVFI